MNPASPHEVPQEFLMVQYEEVEATRRTPWLTELAQLEKTPDLYGDQLEASTATEMGCWLRALPRLSHPGTSTKDESLQFPELILQAWLTAAYGQAAVVVSPWSLTYWKALSIHPPWHPWFPQDPEQSTSCCSARLTQVPASKQADSMAPLAEKAQHDPHDPWFLTGETFPAETQSTSPTIGDSAEETAFSNFLLTLRVRYVVTNSVWVKSENWLIPILQVWVSSALCSATLATFSLKIFSLQILSTCESQFFPWVRTQSSNLIECFWWWVEYRKTEVIPAKRRTARSLDVIEMIINMGFIHPFIGYYGDLSSVIKYTGHHNFRQSLGAVHCKVSESFTSLLKYIYCLIYKFKRVDKLFNWSRGHILLLLFTGQDWQARQMHWNQKIISNRDCKIYIRDDYREIAKQGLKTLDEPYLRR